MKQIGEESDPISWLGVDEIVLHGPASIQEKPAPPVLKYTGVPAGPVAGANVVEVGAASILKLVVGAFAAESVTVIVTVPVAETGLATAKLAVRTPEEATWQFEEANNSVGFAILVFSEQSPGARPPPKSVTEPNPNGASAGHGDDNVATVTKANPAWPTGPLSGTTSIG